MNRKRCNSAYFAHTNTLDTERWWRYLWERGSDFRIFCTLRCNYDKKITFERNRLVFSKAIHGRIIEILWYYHALWACKSKFIIYRNYLRNHQVFSNLHLICPQINFIWLINIILLHFFLVQHKPFVVWYNQCGQR